ncbi:hypothetical protein [Chryseobacterium sp.]|uniref:hypothetical protein n=1 Tax=Chryseobacterium sp. TaxID=1871047 RepID=UPI0012AA4E99|nr:hypothetical protein [Chryseobacterium sp.]QFG54457.1 hypothetical protein F7R58_12640 [Chryseobacterium sp.]
MKKLIFILLSLVIFTNCKAQSKSIKKITPKKNHKMIIPNISKEDIKISNIKDLVSRENKKILERSNDSSQLVNENAKELNFEQNGFASLYKDGKLKLLSKITEDNVQKPIPRKKEHFNSPKEFSQKAQTLVNFFPNENIHTIKQTINTPNGYFPAGNWYVYDESGNLLQHIDHEKYFTMSYYDIAKIADSYDYPVISIGRGFDNKEFSYWLIILEGIQDQQLLTKYIIINDKTGKIIYETNSEEELNNFPGFKEMAKYGEDLYKLFKPN